MTRRYRVLALFLLLPWLPAAVHAVVREPATAAEAAPPASVPSLPVARNGSEIYARFRDGLANPECIGEQSERWRRHFSHVPDDLASKPETLLPLFGYVVDALREVHLPTEYALIPFVESGYRPGARSAAGPAGLWQFIAVTARNHKVAIRPGYDGRLSPVDSTQAAVRYLRTLHGMFAGDWRLAVMGYNAGEYRLFGALKAAGQRAMDAEPDKLAVPAVTRAYVRKLQALSCLLVEAGEREDWLRAIDRSVPVLTAATLPASAASLDAWAQRNGHDAALVRRFNPAFPDGRIARADRRLRVLVPDRTVGADADAETAIAGAGSASPPAPEPAPASEPAPVAVAGSLDTTEVPPHADVRAEGIAAIAAAPQPADADIATAIAAPAASMAAEAPAAAAASTGFSADASEVAAAHEESERHRPPRTHVVARGESIWRIARRYGIGSAQLLARNGLSTTSVLQPGMTLLLDESGESLP